MSITTPWEEPGTVIVRGEGGSLQFWHSKKGIIVQAYGHHGGRKGDAMTFAFDDLAKALEYLLHHNTGLIEKARFETEY